MQIRNEHPAGKSGNIRLVVSTLMEILQLRLINENPEDGNLAIRAFFTRRTIANDVESRIYTIFIYVYT